MTFKKKILNSPSKACSLSIPGIFVKVFFNAKTFSLNKIILSSYSFSIPVTQEIFPSQI